MGDAACSGVLANPSRAAATAAAPPPPPPPPGAGQVPSLRISTASELGPRRGTGGQQQQQQQEGYEPPPAIQNAMMTKDKKPFTYTPGMGGKLDLSQIRSPRMARRVAKNANDEGIEGPPRPAEQEAPRGPAATSVYAPPQVAVPVFPQGGPQPGALGLRNSCLPRGPSAAARGAPLDQLAFAPADGQQPAAPRPAGRAAESPRSPTPPASPATPASPTQASLAKAPTPWMQRQTSREPELPEWAKRPAARGAQEPAARPQQPGAPPRIEDRPSVFTAMNQPGHHQLTNSSPHHVSRWGNPVGQSGYQAPPAAAAYLVPVQLDVQPSQPSGQERAPHRQDARRAPRAHAQQAEPGPLQSQSFRVLQKITDTCSPDQPDAEQLRKLQLTEDDRCLMNKFKEQVDGEQYLHQEEDPRYRGAAIPSRAFRYLQTMTDSTDLPNSTSRPANSAPRKSNRNSSSFEEVPMQPYIPASQQQVQEPKKYTGAAIPSRSFRILQQMTAPESVGPDVTDY